MPIFLSFTISQSLLKLAFVESDAIQPSHPLSPITFLFTWNEWACVRATRHPHSSQQHCYVGGRRKAVLLGRRGYIFDFFHLWLLL